MKFSAGAMCLAIGSRLDSAKRVVSVASWLRDWTVDRQRERRIRELRASVSLAFAIKDTRAVSALARELFAECDARSPAQVKRLERRALAAMDEHMREALGK